MHFRGTRGDDENTPLYLPFSEAILSPIASFGGLYVPETLPEIDEGFLFKYLRSSYKDLSVGVLNLFDLDIEQSVIYEALALYDKFDDSRNPVPVVKVGNKLYVSELYHGPTRAFKDMALQPFGKILSSVAQKRNENYLILAATSGDTGPAALETFKNQKNIQVVCMYPENGTSDVQRLQMVTNDAPNLKVIGIKGNFDDAQNALKNLLSSETFDKALKEKNISKSAANSVNFGRIIFQIIYHIHNYFKVIAQSPTHVGDKIYLNIPSGNFGDALGAFYAMQMGLPVEKIIISSNENKILTDFINTGVYDLRDLKLLTTTSPAMDILKSSNVERVLFALYGSKRTKILMDNLETKGVYKLNSIELAKLQEFFVADYCTDDEGKLQIKKYAKNGYIMDPHTATCFKTHDFLNNKDFIYPGISEYKDIPTVIYSTAEWTKFAPVVAEALTGKKGLIDQVALNEVSRISGSKIPDSIKELFIKRVVHYTVIEKEDIEKEILKYLS